MNSVSENALLVNSQYRKDVNNPDLLTQPYKLDPQKIAQAAQAALRILRDDPTIIVTVKERGAA